MTQTLDRHPAARRSQIEMRIADGVYTDEKRHAAMLGYDGIQVPFMSFGAFCGVWLLSLTPDRPAVLTRFRQIQRKSGISA